MMPLTRRIRVAVVLGALALVAAAGLVARFVLFPPESVPRDAIRVPHESSLEDALRRLAPGGAIALDARRGPFLGPVEVTVPDVTLCSYGGRARIEGAAGAPALAVQADGVALQGLIVSGGSVGILVVGTRCRIEDVELRDCAVGMRLSGAHDTTVRRLDVAATAVGIEISTSSRCDIQSASLRDLSEAGVRQTTSWGTLLAEVRVLRAPIGVLIEGDSRAARISGFTLDDCEEAGVIVRESSDVVLEYGTVLRSGVGIRFDRTTGSQVVGCTVDQSLTDGVLLVQSLQNAIRGNTIRDSGGTGVRLVESAENAVTDDEIRGSPVAVAIEGSAGNLVASNAIRDTAVGIRARDADSTVVLRNTIAARESGALVIASPGSRILQNRVAGGTYGIAAASCAEVAVLHNDVESASGAAFALFGDTRGATVRQNEATRSHVGYLAQGTSRSDLLDNRAIRNEIGAVLAQCGTGVRVEGNHFERNVVGLRQTDDLFDPSSDVARLGGEPPTASAAVVLMNNIFRGNRDLDVENTAAAAVYAAGNRWGASSSGDGGAEPRVSPNVLLQESGWKDDVVIGTGSSEVEGVLGALLAVALSADGYHVVDLAGMGSSEHVRRALAAGDIDLAVGRSIDIAPEAVEIALPARSGWTAVVSTEIADELPELTLSALALFLDREGRSVLWAVPETYGQPQLAQFRAAYGLDRQVRAVAWAATVEEAESLLAVGAAHVALLGSLEEAATASGFVALTDDRHALPSETLSIVAREDFIRGRHSLAELLSRLASGVTSDALRGLVEQVRLFRQSPEDAASEFLSRESPRDY